MKTTFQKSETNFGCYSKSQVAAAKLNDTFTIEDVLNANVPLKDKAWFIRMNCEFTDKQFIEFAIGCALCVLPVYETKYPDNKAPREAIEAAQKYLAGTIGIDELRNKRAAATTYAAAAAAAAAADAAAYAAAAAAAYAYAAADAAAYAYAAADAADDAADGKTDYKQILLQFFKDFTSCKD